MSDARQIEADIYERLSKVIDPELGRSVTDLGMIAAIEAAPASSDAGTYDVTVHVELTVPGCPLSETITSRSMARSAPIRAHSCCLISKSVR